MADARASVTITVRIARPWREVYDFASAPENLPRWASGLGTSPRRVDGEWITDGPEGPVRVRTGVPDEDPSLERLRSASGLPEGAGT
jgi:uncharacterized protein YndB with AHSA1/START domain